MKLSLADLTKQITDQTYLQDLETIKYADLNKTKLKAFATKMVQEVVTGLKKQTLIQTQLAVSGQRPVTFSLETNLINLPYTHYKKIANFFDDQGVFEVKVYFETKSDYLNASGFRIDELASSDEILVDSNAAVSKLMAAISEKLQAVRDYEKPQPKAPATPPAKQVKTAAKKKTTKRKASTKRKTTKTATKKRSKAKK